MGLAALVLAWVATGPSLAASALSQAELVELERLLETLGFAPGPVDGLVDDETEAAIARYHEFAFISGKEPLPSRTLLDEMRSVAGRMTAIREGERRVEPADLLRPGDEGLSDDAPVDDAPVDDAASEVPEDALQAATPAAPQSPEVTPGADPAEALPPSDGPADPTDEPLPAIEPSTSLRAALPQPPPPPPPPDGGSPQSETAAAQPAPEPAARASPADGFVADAVVSLQAGEVERAVALLTAALSFDPANVVAYQLRGSALTFKGDYANAIRDFDEAAELAPDDPEIYHNRCWVLGQARRFEDALRDCDRALGLDADSAEAHHSRAQVFEAMGKMQDALADYAEALRLDPDSPEVTEDARRVGLIE